MRHIRTIIFTILTVGLLAAFLPAPAQAVPTHWDRSVVYVENHAPTYPVSRVARNMDNGSSLTLKVVNKCPINRPCIRIFTTAFASNQFSEQRWGMHDGHTSFADIYLDLAWERRVSNKKERITVCHELAMALGLPHRYGARNTCTSLNLRGKATISKAERRKLDNWY